MYPNHPFWHQPYPPHSGWYRERVNHPSFFYRPLPEVNPSLFMDSAKSMRRILQDASKLLDEMANSKKFSFDLMTAAQNSEQKKVQEMLKKTGIQTIPKVSYTPDGLKLQFSSYVENLDCCHLTLALRWM